MKGYEHLTRCRVCKCTELEPCNPPCAWAPSQGDLCTNCADMIRALSEWQISAHRQSWAALKRAAEITPEPEPCELYPEFGLGG
jgi:hypothetical protein